MGLNKPLAVLAAVILGLSALTASIDANANSTPGDGDLLLQNVAARTLPGAGYSWGFAALAPDRGQLFIARRENGLTVFDVARQKPLKTLENSVGANGVAFVTEHNRAYVANMDGSISVVALDSLKVLKRLPVDNGNLNNAVYDPLNKRVIFTSGRRGDHSTLFWLDPASDRIVGSRDVPAQKLDAPILLKDGTLVLPFRDEDQVALLSGPALVQQRLLSFTGCSKPSAVAADETRQRLFVACRGGSPTLIVADLVSGQAISRLPIDRAVNALAFDERSQQLLIPSGADASLTVVAQDAAGDYRIKGAVGTRPWAHNMVFDAARRQAYLLSMEFTQSAASSAGPKPDPLFHADTFSVLTLKLTH
jgi:DNA-binding beta-propeller fold protein YncE